MDIFNASEFTELLVSQLYLQQLSRWWAVYLLWLLFHWHFWPQLTPDKAKGIGLSLMIWFYCAIVFDGQVLLFLFSFSDYPLEKAMTLLAALNPVDLGRIMILLQLDISALMGYTGALYQKFSAAAMG